MVGWFYHASRLLIYVLRSRCYNRYSGRTVQLRWRSIQEEMGLGLLIAAFVLWLLGQITFDMTVNEPRQNHCDDLPSAFPSVPPS